MRTNYDGVSTTDICHLLEEIPPEGIFSSECFEMIKEVSFRQGYQMQVALPYERMVDLANDTAVDMVMYLDRVYRTGFRVTNWLKFIYNKTMKHYMAQYDSHGNIRSQIVEFEDYLDFLTYHNSLKKSRQGNWDSVHQLEVTDYIKSCGTYLEPFIEGFIIYPKTHRRYGLIKNSILFSLLYGRVVYLYGLKERDKEYITSMYRWSLMEFPRYMQKMMYNDFVPDIEEGKDYETRYLYEN